MSVEPGPAVPTSMAHEPHRDAARPAHERAADLLARMTLDEKIAQLGSAWPSQLSDGERFDADLARRTAPHGLGQVTRVSGSTLLDAEGAATLGNDIQRFLVEETRLGIPALIHEESLHGLTARDAVIHPQSIGLAATWDPGSVERMASFIGRAAAARGARLVLAPIFDITRDPRWGRLEETFGEDTHLVTSLALAYARGVQGQGVLACGKHLVGHGAPEGGFNRAPAHIGPRELREQYLQPFEAAVRTAGLRTVMHAYDELDGVPCVASHELLTAILRDEWGFEGLTVSDYDGVSELIVSHQVTSDLATAAAMALRAGLDTELPRTVAYGEPLREALERGLVEAADIDRAVTRVLRVKFELGLFEQPYVEVGGALIDPAAERELALELARKSIVLLENDGTLPLAPGVRRVALIGPSAHDARNYVGDYAHQLHIDTLLDPRDSIAMDTPIAPTLRHSRATDGIATVLDVLSARSGLEVVHHRGCGLVDGGDAEMAEATEAARGADVAVLVLGERSGLTEDALTGETRDRMDIGLPGRQQELLEAVVATGTPTVLVLVAGRPLAIPWAAEHCAAIVHAWLPGEGAAEAIVDVLTGVVDPGGKLPVTVPRHVGQLPVFYAHKPSGGHSNWNVEYIDGSNRPLWPFGHGRSYTTFELAGLRLDHATIPTDGEARVSVDVINTGAHAGDEVVQLYVRDVEASLTRPVKELRGFARVALEPGQRRTVTFTLAAEQLAFVDVPGRWLLEPGVFRLMVGTSSEELPLALDLTVAGEPRVIERRHRYLTAVHVDEVRSVE